MLVVNRTVPVKTHLMDTPYELLFDSVCLSDQLKVFLLESCKQVDLTASDITGTRNTMKLAIISFFFKIESNCYYFVTRSWLQSL